MQNYTSVISTAVERWMHEENLSQAQAASRLNITQPMLSKRLANQVRWSSDDIDVLAAAGITLPAPTSKEATA